MSKAGYFSFILFLVISTIFSGCSRQEPQEQSEQTQSGDSSAGSEQTQVTGAASQQENVQSPEQTEYFAVFLEGSKIGYAIQTRTLSDDEVTTTIDLEINITRAGASVGVKSKAITLESIDGEPLGYAIERGLGFLTTKTVGVVDTNGMVTATTGQQDRQFEWPEGALMSEGMALLIKKMGLSEGTEYTATIFDPSVGQGADVEVKVGPRTQVDLLGRVVELTEVTSTATLQGQGTVTSLEYYDDDYRLQKSITQLMGMTIEQIACTKEFALGENDVLEIIDKMFVDSPQPVTDMDTVEWIEYQLSLIEPGGAELSIPEDDNQKVEITATGALVTVTPVAMPVGAAFPYQGSDSAAREALEPAEFIQSNDPEIIALAQHAAGDAEDAGQAAKNIEEFVAGYIDNKNLSVGYASALEVAQSRQGDCTEFAVLCAALCRAVGIPARIVAGIAYVDDFMGKSGFGGHAWTEVYIDGKWVGLDSAFMSSNRGGYDAGHIALAFGNGEPADFFNMALTLGRFKIDSVTIIRK